MGDEKVKIIFDAENKVTPAAKSAEDAIKGVGKTAEDTSNKVQKSSSGFNKMFDGIFKNISIGAIAKGLQIAGQKMVELSKIQADYIESLNLLDVAFDGNTKSIREFTSAYSEILNLDEATLINSASHFKMLGQSMGLAADEGERFSKVLTQMNLDVSSLYNLSFKDAQNALQNATMGRGTALKQKTGVSVLESTVQTTLTTLGVDAYVKDMNDTEKAIARVISMMYQLRTSQGDLARTINCGIMLKNIIENFVNLCKKGVNIIKFIFANGKDLYIAI